MSFASSPDRYGSGVRFDKLLRYTFCRWREKGGRAPVFLLMCMAAGVRTGVLGRVRVRVRALACACMYIMM